MALFIANDPDLTNQQSIGFQEHLQNCPECAKEYEESKFAIELAKQNWQISGDTLALIEKAGKDYKLKMTVEEGWKDLCKRCPDLAESKEKYKSLQPFIRIGTVAACLVIGILTWMVFSNHSKPHVLPQPSSSSTIKQVASVSKPSVKVELVSDDGKLLIPPGHKIATAKELKNLIINDKQRILMNIDTTLSIEPLLYNGFIGCIVKLTSGEIFVKVEHDGNPFVVSTTHGKAVITGTSFYMKVTSAGTTLVVSEGTVQFESEKSVVNVAAGQTSIIVAESAPTKPISCNTVELTTWVTNYETKDNSSQIEATLETDDISDLPLLIIPEPIELESINYEHWIEQKRDWFKQEFPWIFQLKEALAKEGIEVDYPELLIKTGDVWQFVCLDVQPTRFSVIDPNSLLKTASDYGFDKLWLLENIQVAKSTMEKPALSENSFTGLKAFERWLEHLNETRGVASPTPIYSYHASKYLAETRSLIWFAVKDGQYDLTDEEHTKVLDLLQKEVTAACKCQNDVSYPVDGPEPSCYEDKRQKLAKHITELVSDIYGYEKRLVKYVLPVSLMFK